MPIGRNSKCYISIFILTIFLSSLALIFEWSKYFTLIFIILIDFFLAIVLIIAAILSDTKKDKTKWSKVFIYNLLPTRFVGLFVLFSIIVSSLLLFSNLYYIGKNEFGGSLKIIGKEDAIYFSTVTATTVGFGDITPNKTRTKLLVIFQIGSSALIFFSAFPLLISRLSVFSHPDSKDYAAWRDKHV